MQATATNTNTPATVQKEKPKKKLSYYQKKKAIDEIAKSMNAGMTRRYLFDMLFREKNDTHNWLLASILLPYPVKT